MSGSSPLAPPFPLTSPSCSHGRPPPPTSLLSSPTLFIVISPHYQLSPLIIVMLLSSCRPPSFIIIPLSSFFHHHPIVLPLSSSPLVVLLHSCHSPSFTMALITIPPTIHPTSSCSWGWGCVVCSTMVDLVPCVTIVIAVPPSSLFPCFLVSCAPPHHCFSSPPSSSVSPIVILLPLDILPSPSHHCCPPLLAPTTPHASRGSQ